MTFESEPLDVQQQSDESFLPEQPRIWTPALRVLATLVALIGLVAILYGAAGRPLGTIPFSPSAAAVLYALTDEQATFLLNCLFFAVCVAGLWFTQKDVLLRIGVILRAVALLGAILQTFPAAAIAFVGFQPWLISFSSVPFLFTTPFMQLFQLTSGILALLSQLCFSYSLARWQSSDKVYIWGQLAVTLGLGIVILQATSYSYLTISWAYALEIEGGTFLSIATAACFLLRPACWKASSLIILCMTAGSVLSLLFSEAFETHTFTPGSTTQILQTSYAIGLGGSTLLIIGVLLLMQRSREQKEPERTLEQDLVHLDTPA